MPLKTCQKEASAVPARSWWRGLQLIMTTPLSTVLQLRDVPQERGNHLGLKQAVSLAAQSQVLHKLQQKLVRLLGHGQSLHSFSYSPQEYF